MAKRYVITYDHPALGVMKSQRLTRKQVQDFLPVLGRLGADVLKVVRAK